MNILFFTRAELDKIKNTKLEIYCLSIRIWQKFDGGLELQGHGTIKQNKFGTIYLEFVCIETNFKRTGNLTDTVPADLLNPKEMLYGEFITLDEKKIISKEFTLKMDAFSMHNKRVIHIILPYIEIVKKSEIPNKVGTYLKFEFSELVDIPFNKSNESTCTSTGSTSFSRNQAVIKTDDYEVSILKENEYAVVTVTGDFDVGKLFDSIIFYIGFSCGCMPQPYITFMGVGDEMIIKIRSINNQKSHKRSSNPIPSNVTHDGSMKGEYSYALLNNIICLQQQNLSSFMCIYSQWVRVWHGFTTINDISELVLSVAIEGILNDIYIPIFKQNRANIKLSDDIELIKNAINTMEGIEPDYKSRLISSVCHWKVITASKAFDILLDENVINTGDKKIWNKMRNDSAHPKTKELNSAEACNKRNNLIRCLNLFNKLVLNIVGYTGPINFFEVGTSNPLQILEYINILDDKENNS